MGSVFLNSAQILVRQKSPNYLMTFMTILKYTTFKVKTALALFGQLLTFFGYVLFQLLFSLYGSLCALQVQIPILTCMLFQYLLLKVIIGRYVFIGVQEKEARIGPYFNRMKTSVQRSAIYTINKELFLML